MTHRFVFLGIVFLSCGLLRAQENKTLTVKGEGTAFATPDRATVELIVKTIDTDAPDALSSNKKAVRNVLEKLNAEKIDARSVSTSDIRVEPLNIPAGGKAEFAASTTLRIIALPLNTLGVTLEHIVTSEVSGLRLTFYQSNPDSAESAAIAQAVLDATAKATKFADSFKLRLGKLLNVTASCSAAESVRSTYEGPLNIYKISEMSKTLLVFPPRLAYDGKIEAVFGFTAKE